ncbi:Imm40 family immunity protein [Neorhizobium sp. BETTINA12A]|uniref:Imm40 family immunity protein n=1 Tax=Neorhizobium sp. BETTINA12A TaxID=2908924 RepID=UPI001FF1BECF|nr:Imm40 family immunity protein [Neorhizobium sp. BETTINA12A]MCJ9753646.1 Imm40 family immunity protein [Neorhizobium sp. BETTINA12A]
MLRMWNNAIVDILSQGIWLGDYGTRNWALTRGQAIDALDRLSLIGVPVSGGDVYIFFDGKYVSTYENWYFEDQGGQDYAEKSIEYSKDFVERFDAFEEPFFVLVPHLD